MAAPSAAAGDECADLTRHGTSARRGGSQDWCPWPIHHCRAERARAHADMAVLAHIHESGNSHAHSARRSTPFSTPFTPKLSMGSPDHCRCAALSDMLRSEIRNFTSNLHIEYICPFWVKRKGNSAVIKTGPGCTGMLKSWLRNDTSLWHRRYE